MDNASSWSGDLNPVQRSALEYLRDANRFSRSPSHVAEFLGTTRGTMSQTLKALLRKGFVQEVRSESDKRSISYALTRAGSAVLAEDGVIAVALTNLTDQEVVELESGLRQTLRQALKLNGGKSFGQCKTCRYHEAAKGAAFCQLLSVPLSAEDSEKICIEHEEAVVA
ncbi:MarR family winged helix-turn-helix transcriptional regulator [Roseovarius aestuarii]|uniref:MarR family winged helix-turn-helix transcriptional regulator n=1 Tax=Roseovarius aestuarii TaxID=475083 RepID=UPI001FD366AE|nr:MarR family winged helix-turn-helix transcriptional regulator [Roseovarius aestuarii]